MASWVSSIHVAWVGAIMLLLLMSAMQTHAQLTPTFYEKSCPAALKTIRKAVRTAIAKERRMAASLIRLHFHDCFVQGCDASVLLDDAPSINSEKNAFQNFRSLRGFEVVDSIKAAVEKVCSGVVSCADILAVASRDASEYVNGPTWTVKLGRRDSTTASKDLAEADLPIAFNDLDAQISSFANQGLSVRDMVALSGAHTIGQAQCATFRGRVYNDTNIDAGFARMRRRGCPVSDGNGNLAPLDLVTPNSFDNNYFKNLIKKKGLLHSDQVLFNGGSTDDIVTSYSTNKAAFYSDFASAMLKMGDIKTLTGSSGQIRKICSIVN
ncbi:lignin-forming anionic peroxidase-like [Dioscorea cayenensis subsp. rotundata]|uniref:Peroxidase n=1 Tax=Dioscorea cayennensis subsp. rotundata TaxID=55577 RepID=A0AB40CF75_DIOCR|nr:lignin-forming anionic peroxidase-like [Dioscorea cayenensis subsp. rotundata]